MSKMILSALSFAVINTALCNPPATVTTSVAKEYLVTAELKQSPSAEELKKAYPTIAAFVKNGFKAYKVTYNTVTPDGKPIVASGAMYVPDVSGNFPVLNYNHGTIFPSREKSAPSYMSGYDYEAAIAKLFAANGYVTVVPDYLGYGSSKDSDHPYGVYNVIAQASADMIYAVKEFSAKNKISLSGKYFVSGWSEGAAVGLATVKLLEQRNDPDLKVSAAVLNAGPYFSSAFAEHILDAGKPMRYMTSYIWVLKSFNKLYGFNRPMSYYFNEPYATRLEKTFEAEISTEPRELFRADFIDRFMNGRDTLFSNALSANDLWKTKTNAKIVLVHGDKDDYVPLFNSEKAYTEMKKAGSDVDLKVLKGQNHTSGVFAFLQTAYDTFEAKR